MTERQFIREAARRLRILKMKHEPLADNRLNNLALQMTKCRMTKTPTVTDDELKSLIMEVFDKRSAAGFLAKVFRSLSVDTGDSLL